MYCTYKQRQKTLEIYVLSKYEHLTRHLRAAGFNTAAFNCTAFISAAYDGATFIRDANSGTAYAATLVYTSPFIPTKGDLRTLL
jgi:hypothetical protein